LKHKELKISMKRDFNALNDYAIFADSYLLINFHRLHFNRR